MSKNEDKRTSIVFDEVNALANRLKIVADNSGNPVDMFLACQLMPIVGNLVADITSMMANPELDRIAKEFADSAPKTPFQ